MAKSIARNKHTGTFGLFRRVEGKCDHLTGRCKPDRIAVYLPATGTHSTPSVSEFKKHWTIT